MFFTQEDYRKIEEWLKRNSIKDSEFKETDILKEGDTLNIIQDGENKKIKVENFNIKLENIYFTTYSQLIQDKNNGILIAGAYYVITDYVAITNQDKTITLKNPFYILVQATSENTLGHQAKAIKDPNTTYFNDSNLEAWELKYDIDNDNSKYSWATESGKGVIYYMKDEYNNEAPYDFKGIGFLISTNNYYSTFSDSSKNDISLIGKAHDNIIKPYRNNNVLTLNHTVFIGNSVYANTIEENNYNNIFKCNYCYNNTIGKDFQNNIIASLEENILISFYNNIIGNVFKNNKIQNTFHRNTIGINTNDCIFASDFNYNEVGNNSWYINFNYPVSYCKFGSYIQYCVFNNTDAYPPIETEMKWCSFGDGLEGAQYIPCCQNVTFEDRCLYSTTGNWHINDITLTDGKYLAELLTSNHSERLYFYKEKGSDVLSENDPIILNIRKSVVYDLGNFDTSSLAEAKAATPEICNDPTKIILSYRVGDNYGIIEQHVVVNSQCIQYIQWGGGYKTRKIPLLSDGRVSYVGAWVSCAPNRLEYTASTRYLELVRHGEKFGGVTLPLANSTDSGLMSANDKLKLDDAPEVKGNVLYLSSGEYFFPSYTNGGLVISTGGGLIINNNLYALTRPADTAIVIASVYPQSQGGGNALHSITHLNLSTYLDVMDISDVGILLRATQQAAESATIKISRTEPIKGLQIHTSTCTFSANVYNLPRNIVIKNYTESGNIIHTNTALNLVLSTLFINNYEVLTKNLYKSELTYSTTIEASNTDTINITHGLDSQYPVVTVYRYNEENQRYELDSSPSIALVDTNNITVNLKIGSNVIRVTT